MSLSSHVEPNTYSKTIQREIDSLESTKTWEISLLPKDKVAIGCKWVFKIKYKANGTIDRYKTRLVEKGYTKTKGIDYFDTFSPTTKITTIRLLLSLAFIYNWKLKQLNINNVFLH